MPRPKKVEAVEPEKVPEPPKAPKEPSELERKVEEQKHLLGLREELAKLGADSPKLDILLSKVNERVRQLS